MQAGTGRKCKCLTSSITPLRSARRCRRPAAARIERQPWTPTRYGGEFLRDYFVPAYRLLSELKVNPPGTEDEPYEFVEIKGEPNTLLTNVYLLAIQGDFAGNPGKADLVLNLTSRRLGSSGLLLIAARDQPYPIPEDTTVVTDTNFNNTSNVHVSGSYRAID